MRAARLMGTGSWKGGRRWQGGEGWRGGVIFGATGEKNPKWLHAKSTPPSKLLPCQDKEPA